MPTTLTPASRARSPTATPNGIRVFGEPGEPADEGVRADAHKLMRRRTAAHDRVVADPAMAGQHHVVGEDHPVADPAIVRRSWLPARNVQPAPTDVSAPPPAVPGFIVTLSRIKQSAPMVRTVRSPRYLRSCGSWPMEANGKDAGAGAHRRLSRHDDVG